MLAQWNPPNNHHKNETTDLSLRSAICQFKTFLYCITWCTFNIRIRTTPQTISLQLVLLVVSITPCKHMHMNIWSKCGEFQDTDNTTKPNNMSCISGRWYTLLGKYILWLVHTSINILQYTLHLVPRSCTPQSSTSTDSMYM